MIFFRPCILLILLCLTVLSCSGETLKELLISNHLPLTPFSLLELAQEVQGIGNSNEHQTAIAYRKVDGGYLVGPTHLLKFDMTSNALLRSETTHDQADICSGSSGAIYFIGKFTLLSTELSPSAECLLVLDKNLKLHKTLFGFDPVEVARGRVVIIEDMVHFAPVHAERLQLANLTTGVTTELYPIMNDALRTKMIAAHESHMPTPETCAQMNDPCEPEDFDEDIDSMTTDRNGRFAFLVSQSASHATTPEQAPVTVASQTELYTYIQTPIGWRYCEKVIPDFEIQSARNSLRNNFAQVIGRCRPTLPVVPDMSTADLNPFITK